MSEAVHCPFLNRSDHRCCEFFKLNRLGHAYTFCFDGYKSCPVYADLLSERQFRRSNDRNLVQITFAKRQYAETAHAA